MTGILVGEGLGCGFVHPLRAALRWLAAPIAYGTSPRGRSGEVAKGRGSVFFNGCRWRGVGGGVVLGG